MAMISETGYTPLCPQSYTAPAPPTGPKCEDLPIDVQFELLRRNAAEADRPESDTQDNVLSLTDQLKSYFSQAVRTAQAQAGSIQLTTEAQVRGIQVMCNAKLFQSLFPELHGSGEAFVASFPCSAAHGEGTVNGLLFITRNYLCFASTSAGAIAAASDAVKSRLTTTSSPTSQYLGATIPLTSIVSVVPSVAMATSDGIPHFTPVPSEAVIPTALDVYDTNLHRFQFFNFSGLNSRVEGLLYHHIKGTPVQFAYNYIDHAWREVVHS